MEGQSRTQKSSNEPYGFTAKRIAPTLFKVYVVKLEPTAKYEHPQCDKTNTVPCDTSISFH